MGRCSALLVPLVLVLATPVQAGYTSEQGECHKCGTNTHDECDGVGCIKYVCQEHKYTYISKHHRDNGPYCSKNCIANDPRTQAKCECGKYKSKRKARKAGHTWKPSIIKGITLNRRLEAGRRRLVEAEVRRCA